MTSPTTKNSSTTDQEFSADATSDIHQNADPFQVVLEHKEHPQQLPELKKWWTVFVIGSSALCVTCASSLASFTEDGVANEFHVSHTISILAISLFVAGLGLGPLLVGPLSEVYGRNLVYRVSYGLFFVFAWPVSFSPNIGVYLAFRFITGFCGSAFLSVGGGSVSDMFSDKTVANPMALYTISPFIGPVFGPFLSGFMPGLSIRSVIYPGSAVHSKQSRGQNLDWRWTYHIEAMWTFGELLSLLSVPETYIPILEKWKAKQLREKTGDDRYWSQLDKTSISLPHSIIVSCYKPFQLLVFDRMALLLDMWTALVLGILYLAFQAFPIIFEDVHGFNMQSTGMAFLGIGLGMILGISTQPYWNHRYKRIAQDNGGSLPPEARLLMGEVGGILVPIGLYWMAFTTYRRVPWIVPIIASIPFGSGIYFVFTSTFTYLVTAYRPIAASAMASNSAMRSLFAAAFPLFAGAMYHRLGTVGATALLAGLTTLMAPLPFVFRRMGPQLRKKSRFAVS